MLIRIPMQRTHRTRIRMGFLRNSENKKKRYKLLRNTCFKGRLQRNKTTDRDIHKNIEKKN